MAFDSREVARHRLGRIQIQSVVSPNDGGRVHGSTSANAEIGSVPLRACFRTGRISRLRRMPRGNRISGGPSEEIFLRTLVAFLSFPFTPNKWKRHKI